MNILDSLRWRYACKSFNPDKKITPENVQILKESLRLTPSSYGLQPWKFLFITDPEIRAQLRPHSWNQGQIVDASHLVVLCRRESIDAEYVEKFIQSVADTQGKSVEDLAGYKELMNKNVVDGATVTDQASWMTHQVYIALGNLMTVAATMEIDTCPIEGFEPEKYDEILGLKEKGLASCVVCALGYHADDDWNYGAPKVRWPLDQVVEEV